LNHYFQTKKIINSDNFHDEEALIIDDSQIIIFNETKQIYELVVETSKYISNNTGDRDNMQYNPALVKRLLDFCKLIPCWSALMVPIFKYGNLTVTNCASESLFKDLKTIVLKHKTLPIRLDEFLQIHINSILGSMNIIRDKTCNSKRSIKSENNTIGNVEKEKVFNNTFLKNKILCDEETQIKTYEQTNINWDENIHYDDSSILENWKGLGYQVGEKKHTSIKTHQFYILIILL
jgi:hypothetical protein